MNHHGDKYWREALQLESASLVKRIYNRIHARTLSTTRARQIVAAYLQGREYYRNAAQADISVKPLLLFYGVSSLSRCLTLLMKPHGGEETLAQSHGLTCNGWSELLTTDIGGSLSRLGELSVKSCSGLFGELLQATDNRSFLHVRSSVPDWSIGYGVPALPMTVEAADVVSRIPDLQEQYTLWTEAPPLNVIISSIEPKESRLEMNVGTQGNIEEIMGYTEGRAVVTDEGTLKKLVIDSSDIPLFMNSYVEKKFVDIPRFHLAAPLPNTLRIAQIPLTFILSYYVGMLCRYFPSHWMALRRGSKGDEIWPLMQVSMQYIDAAFPQLLMEFIEQSGKGEDT